MTHPAWPDPAIIILDNNNRITVIKMMILDDDRLIQPIFTGAD